MDLLVLPKLPRFLDQGRINGIPLSLIYRLEELPAEKSGPVAT